MCYHATGIPWWRYCAIDTLPPGETRGRDATCVVFTLPHHALTHSLTRSVVLLRDAGVSHTGAHRSAHPVRLLTLPRTLARLPSRHAHRQPRRTPARHQLLLHLRHLSYQPTHQAPVTTRRHTSQPALLRHTHHAGRGGQVSSSVCDV